MTPKKALSFSFKHGAHKLLFVLGVVQNAVRFLSSMSIPKMAPFRSGDTQYSYFISNHRSAPGWKNLFGWAGWQSIEQCFEETKSELGAGPIWGTKVSWMAPPYLTCMLAHYFLWHLKIRLGKKFQLLRHRSLGCCYEQSFDENLWYWNGDLAW